MSKTLYPNSIRIGLMNPAIAQIWAQRILSDGTTVGSIKKGDTINHTTSQPIATGLFCQRIFGPCTDYTCACGHEKIRIGFNPNIAPPVCSDCHVEWTHASVRRQFLGSIDLISPVTHKWFSDSRGAYIPTLLGITPRTFRNLKECKLFFPFGLKKNQELIEYSNETKKGNGFNDLEQENLFASKNNGVSSELSKPLSSFGPNVGPKVTAQSMIVAQKARAMQTLQLLIDPQKSLNPHFQENLQLPNKREFYFLSDKLLYSGNSSIKNIFSKFYDVSMLTETTSFLRSKEIGGQQSSRKAMKLKTKGLAVLSGLTLKQETHLVQSKGSNSFKLGKEWPSVGPKGTTQSSIVAQHEYGSGTFSFTALQNTANGYRTYSKHSKQLPFSSPEASSNPSRATKTFRKVPYFNNYKNSSNKVFLPLQARRQKFLEKGSGSKNQNFYSLISATQWLTIEQALSLKNLKTPSLRNQCFTSLIKTVESSKVKNQNNSFSDNSENTNNVIKLKPIIEQVKTQNLGLLAGSKEPSFTKSLIFQSRSISGLKDVRRVRESKPKVINDNLIFDWKAKFLLSETNLEKKKILRFNLSDSSNGTSYLNSLGTSHQDSSQKKKENLKYVFVLANKIDKNNKSTVFSESFSLLALQNKQASLNYEFQSKKHLLSKANFKQKPNTLLFFENILQIKKQNSSVLGSWPSATHGLAQAQLSSIPKGTISSKPENHDRVQNIDKSSMELEESLKSQAQSRGSKIGINKSFLVGKNGTSIFRDFPKYKLKENSEILFGKNERPGQLFAGSTSFIQQVDASKSSYAFWLSWLVGPSFTPTSPRYLSKTWRGTQGAMPGTKSVNGHERSSTMTMKQNGNKRVFSSKILKFQTISNYMVGVLANSKIGLCRTLSPFSFKLFLPQNTLSIQNLKGFFQQSNSKELLKKDYKSFFSYSQCSSLLLSTGTKLWYLKHKETLVSLVLKANFYGFKRDIHWQGNQKDHGIPWEEAQDPLSSLAVNSTRWPCGDGKLKTTKPSGVEPQSSIVALPSNFESQASINEIGSTSQAEQSTKAAKSSTIDDCGSRLSSNLSKNSVLNKYKTNSFKLKEECSNLINFFSKDLKQEKKNQRIGKKNSYFEKHHNFPIRPSYTQPEDYRRQFIKFLGKNSLIQNNDVPISRYTLTRSQLINKEQIIENTCNSFTQKSFNFLSQQAIEVYFSEAKSVAKEQTIKNILSQTGGGGLQRYLELVNLSELVLILQNDLAEISPRLAKSQSTRRVLLSIINDTSNSLTETLFLLNNPSNKNKKDYGKSIENATSKGLSSGSTQEQYDKEKNISDKSGNGLDSHKNFSIDNNAFIVENKKSSYYPNQLLLSEKIEILEKKCKDVKKEYKAVKKICSDFQNRKNAHKRRYKLAFQLLRTMSNPAGMTMSSVPVLPPGLRPIIDVPKIGPITADLNIRYRSLLFALRNLRELAYVDFRNAGAAQASVQEAVDDLLYTGGKTRREKSNTNPNLYKSLAMRLKGKHGRFRGNLLGKRVDYSGRSVIVVGPTLKIHQCGLPFEIAIKLFNPFLIRSLIQRGFCKNVYKAKQILIRGKFKPLIWTLCQEVMSEHLVLLNRAPTLHRLGVQAFMPVLISGRAILLHPLVCTGFNADFDGDQMGVHVPLFPQARAEAWKMMWSRNNFLLPSSGEPVLLPSQDMVLGCYYLTSSTQKVLETPVETPEYNDNFSFPFRILNIKTALNGYTKGTYNIQSIVWINLNKTTYVKLERFFHRYHKKNLSIKLYNPEIQKMEDDGFLTPTLELRITPFGVMRLVYAGGIKNFTFQNSLLLPGRQTVKPPVFALFVRTTIGRLIFNNLLEDLRSS